MILLLTKKILVWCFDIKYGIPVGHFITHVQTWVDGHVICQVFKYITYKTNTHFQQIQLLSL